MSNDNVKKICIMSLETGAKIYAGYNPKELSFDKKATWTDEPCGTPVDYANLQFTNGTAITMTVELLFDSYEADSQDVRPTIQSLLSLAMVDKKLKRPPLVTVVWGDNDMILSSGRFTGVVEGVTTKYTMFTSAGIPCRATASVSLKQADTVSVTPASVGSTDKGVTFTTKCVSNAGQLTDSDKEAILAQNPDFKEENANYPLTYTVSKSN